MSIAVMFVCGLVIVCGLCVINPVPARQTTGTITMAEWRMLMDQAIQRYDSEMLAVNPGYTPSKPILTQKGHPKGRTNWGLARKKRISKKNQRFTLRDSSVILELERAAATVRSFNKPQLVVPSKHKTEANNGNVRHAASGLEQTQKCRTRARKTGTYAG